MNRINRMFLTALMLISVVSLAPALKGADNCFDKLPFGCFVSKSEVISKNQTDAIGKKLGAPLKKLSNTYLQIQGAPIQINILEAKTNADDSHFDFSP